MPFLNLPSSQFETVWSLIRDRLNDDPGLNASGVTRIFIEANNSQSLDVNTYAPPVILFIPRMGPRRLEDESGQGVGNLVVTMQVLLEPADSVDHLRLQKAVELAVNSYRDESWLTELIEAGAETGIVTFDQPLNPPPSKIPTLNQMLLAGQFTVSVIEITS